MNNNEPAAERFVERFFLSVNSCMIGSYLRFEKK